MKNLSKLKEIIEYDRSLLENILGLPIELNEISLPALADALQLLIVHTASKMNIEPIIPQGLIAHNSNFEIASFEDYANFYDVLQKKQKRKCFFDNYNLSAGSVMAWLAHEIGEYIKIRQMVSIIKYINTNENKDGGINYSAEYPSDFYGMLLTYSLSPLSVNTTLKFIREEEKQSDGLKKKIYKDFESVRYLDEESKKYIREQLIEYSRIVTPEQCNDSGYIIQKKVSLEKVSLEQLKRVLQQQVKKNEDKITYHLRFYDVDSSLIVKKLSELPDRRLNKKNLIEVFFDFDKLF